MNALKYKYIIYPAFVFILSFIFLTPLITGVFLFDDKYFIESNEKIKTLEGVKDSFATSIYGSEKKHRAIYRPVYILSLYMNEKLFGHSPFAFHFIDLYHHALVSMLFYLILASFFGHTLKSFFPAAVFAVHPVHIDALAFIHNRSEVLAGLFLLIATLIILKNRYFKSFLKNKVTHESDKKKTLLAGIFGIFFFSLALFSKESAASYVLIVIFAFTLAAIEQKNKSSLMPVIILLLGFVFVLISYLSIRTALFGSLGSAPEHSFFKDAGFTKIFPTVSRIFTDYILLLVYPVSLKVSYIDYDISKNIYELRAVFSYFLHIIVITAGFLCIKKKPVFAFLIGGFYLSLIPVSNIIPFPEIKAERFLYIPSILFCSTIAALIGKYLEHKKIRIWIISFLTAVIVLFGILSFNYSRNFVSRETLWTEMIKRSPENVKVRLNLGLYYFYDKASCKDAKEHLLKAIELNNLTERAYVPLAICFHSEGKNEYSKMVFEEGLRLFPNNEMLNINYAVMNYKVGDYISSWKYIQKAKALAPKNEMANKAFNEIKKKYEELEKTENKK